MEGIDRERILSHLDPETERPDGARIIDATVRALRDEVPVRTHFLDPHGLKVAAGVIESIPAASYRAYGGYPGAERRRLLVFPQFYLVELLEDPVSAIELESPGAGLSHRDCLGAILGTGLKRDMVGDILVTGRGFQAVVAVESVEFLLHNLDRIGAHPVRAYEIDPERLEVEPERVREIKATVASLRLDAVAGAGFGASRTKMAREIKSERVKVNWAPVTSPSHTVSEGDVLSIRGRGRVIVEQVAGTTRKGRINILLKRLN